MSVDCAKCGERVKIADALDYLSCSHYTHTTCTNQDDIDMCPACKNPGSTTPLKKNAAVSEPRPVGDATDYVLHPGRKGTRLNVFAKHPATDTLRTRAPLSTIRKTYGLQHFLKEGATLRDFLANGYTLSDLRVFDDISNKGEVRAKQAFSALGATAQDFLDYEAALPFAEFSQLTGVDAGATMTLFGAAFDGRGILSCRGSDPPGTLIRLRANHCAHFGVTFGDLRAAGLGTLDAYSQLFEGFNPEEIAALERQIGTTESNLAELLIADEEEEESPADVVVRCPRTDVERIKQVYTEDEEEEEEEDSSLSDANPVRAPLFEQPRRVPNNRVDTKKKKKSPVASPPMKPMPRVAATKHTQQNVFGFKY